MVEKALQKLSLSTAQRIDNEPYILNLEYNGSKNLCAITPSGLRILDCDSLAVIRKLNADVVKKVGQYTDCRFVDEHCVIASSPDGFLRVWDTRAGDSTTLVLASTSNDADSKNGELKPLLCCDVSLDKSIVCAGTEAIKDDAFILFWDIRNASKLLGGYWESFSQDVTQTRFHASNRSLLATAALDGLVNIFDIDELVEADALKHTLNAYCAINNIIWLQPENNVDRLGVVTTDEEVQLWPVGEAESICTHDRETLDNEIPFDHVVGSFCVDDIPFFVTSTNDGSVDFWSLEKGAHVGSLTGTHEDLVRSFAVMTDKSQNTVSTIWTTGEDGIVCRWNANSIEPASEPEIESNTETASPPPRKRRKGK